MCYNPIVNAEACAQNMIQKWTALMTSYEGKSIKTGTFLIVIVMIGISGKFLLACIRYFMTYANYIKTLVYAQSLQRCGVYVCLVQVKAAFKVVVPITWFFWKKSW